MERENAGVFTSSSDVSGTSQTSLSTSDTLHEANTSSSPEGQSAGAGLPSLPGAAAGVVVLVGALALMGWTLDIPALKGVLPGLPTMKANTAAAFVLAGFSLWLARRGATTGLPGLVGRSCAGIVALLGFLTLAQYLFGWDLGIDQLPMRETPTPPGDSKPGRMSLHTAVNFALLGFALILLQGGRRQRASQILSLPPAVIALTAILSYLYGVRALYAAPQHTQIALHTAFAFFILSAGVLAARPGHGLVATITSERIGGNLARRLLPVAIAVPAALGWLRLFGERAGLYGTEFGLVLMVTLSIVLLAAAIWLKAALLNEADAERERAAEALRRLNVELEQRVSERTAELEAANRELDAFTYSVAHDLRSPVRAIDGFARLLEENAGTGLSEQHRHCLDNVIRNAADMSQLIDDLLRLSRLGRQSLEVRTVATDAIVRDALGDLRAEREGRQVSLVIGELPPCKGDPALLKQLWLNLLSNAHKFTRGREPAVIEVGCQEENGERVFFVRDNGAGFDMRYADKLFGIFQRLHRAEEYEGTGVGLALVQRIVQRHGGRVWAISEPGRGATFSFTLGAGGLHAHTPSCPDRRGPTC